MLVGRKNHFVYLIPFIKDIIWDLQYVTNSNSFFSGQES